MNILAKAFAKKMSKRISKKKTKKVSERKVKTQAKKRASYLCFSLFLGMLVSGCQNSIDSEQARVANDYIKLKPRYQKQGAAISLTNSQVNLDAAGVPYLIDLGIHSKYPSGEMTVSVSSSKGLYIVAGETNFTSALSKGEIAIPYTVAATESGRYYLYANVSVRYNGESSFRALTFIVQVGKSASQKAFNVDETPASLKSSTQNTGSEETMITMPANEEIIQ